MIYPGLVSGRVNLSRLFKKVFNIEWLSGDNAVAHFYLCWQVNRNLKRPHILTQRRKTIVMVLRLAWRGDLSLCGGLGNFRLHSLRWRYPWFRCGGPDRRPGGAWHWPGNGAGDHDGHFGGAGRWLRCSADLGLRCGAGRCWWLRRWGGSWNLRLHGSCSCWHSWSSTKTGGWVRVRKMIWWKYSIRRCATVHLLFGELHTRYTCPHIPG